MFSALHHYWGFVLISRSPRKVCVMTTLHRSGIKWPRQHHCLSIWFSSQARRIGDEAAAWMKTWSTWSSPASDRCDSYDRYDRYDRYGLSKSLGFPGGSSVCSKQFKIQTWRTNSVSTFSISIMAYWLMVENFGVHDPNHSKWGGRIPTSNDCDQDPRWHQK